MIHSTEKPSTAEPNLCIEIYLVGGNLSQPYEKKIFRSTPEANGDQHRLVPVEWRRCVNLEDTEALTANKRVHKTAKMRQIYILWPISDSGSPL